jgi:hypothetical protein
MLIWSGYGILVAPIAFISVIAAMIVTAAFASEPDYIRNHAWPGGVGLIIAGVACWYLGGWLRNRRNRTLVDPKTGEQLTLRPGTSFFFIPMRARGPILGVIGLFLIAGNVIERTSASSKPAESQSATPAATSTP